MLSRFPATLQCPAIGYGIRYEFGIFDQEIRDGWQTEVTDKWLRYGYPWEIANPSVAYYVNWGGHTGPYQDEQGRYRVRWVPFRVVKGVAYDTPIQGYQGNTCNTLRLWSAEAIESFDFQAFNTGDYYQAVEAKTISETVTKVLYPNDEPEIGKLLRLAQQYFFASCSLQDMLHILDMAGEPTQNFAQCYAVQLNDTHPSIGVAELMRLLMDEHGLGWDEAGPSPCKPSAIPTTPCCPRRSRPGRCPCSGNAAAAPGNHLRDQRPLPRRGARALSRR